MPALAPAALEALDRKFIWDTYCGCGAPAVVAYRGDYYCRACWGSH